MGHNDILFYITEMTQLIQKFIEKYSLFNKNQENDFLDSDRKFYINDIL